MAKIILPNEIPRQYSLAWKFKQLMLVTQDGLKICVGTVCILGKWDQIQEDLVTDFVAYARPVEELWNYVFAIWRTKKKQLWDLFHLWNSLDIKWMYASGDITKLPYVCRTGTLPLFLELSPRLQRNALYPSSFQTIAMCWINIKRGWPWHIDPRVITQHKPVLNVHTQCLHCFRTLNSKDAPKMTMVFLRFCHYYTRYLQDSNLACRLTQPYKQRI